VGLGNERL